MHPGEMTSGDDKAVPTEYPHAEAARGKVLYTLEVDGEVFAVRRAPGGGTGYDWVSGPNDGYGFGSSAQVDQPEDEHRSSIRNFLSMIDPETGYIAED